jgi:hypothetical protein
MMLSMIMVSHLSWSQYPLIKKLGKDEVVIMTVKQGEDINKQFSVMQDSINLLKKNIFSVQSNYDILHKKNIFLLDSLKNTNAELKESKVNLNWAKSELTDYRKGYSYMFKEYKVLSTSLTLATILFVGLFSFFSKNF